MNHVVYSFEKSYPFGLNIPVVSVLANLDAPCTDQKVLGVAPFFYSSDVTLLFQNRAWHCYFMLHHYTPTIMQFSIWICAITAAAYELRCCVFQVVLQLSEVLQKNYDFFKFTVQICQNLLLFQISQSFFMRIFLYHSSNTEKHLEIISEQNNLNPNTSLPKKMSPKLLCVCENFKTKMI